MGSEIDALPRGHYACIYADPPWSFLTRSPKGMDRAPDYRVMSYQDILDLPVREIAAPDAYLFLWITNPMTPKIGEVMEAWGFTYSSVAFTWAKLNPSGEGWHMGLGYGTRQNTERCYLGRRGSPKRISKSMQELVVWPRAQHSRKPAAVRGRIEEFCAGPRIELFARERAPGWDVFGDQVGFFTEPAAPSVMEGPQTPQGETAGAFL